MIITSINNDLVKETAKLQQKKYRDAENKFLLEGFKCVEEAINSDIKIDKIFLAQKKASWANSLKPNLQEKIILTGEPVLKKISATDTAPEIVAVAVKKIYSINDFKTAEKLVLLENIKDLGNLGTILRTCTAFNADGIILFGKECTDIYSPKCVRSSVGNLWKIPFIYLDDTGMLKTHFSKFEKIATLPKAKTYLNDYKTDKPVLVMFGSEADGLSNELVEFSNSQIKIEMADNVESLNLSVSCAVVLYKLFL